MSTVTRRRVRGRCLLLENVDWRTYSRLLRVFAERPHLHLTYDRGRLEMMTPLFEHDTDGDFLGQLARALTEELGLNIIAGGSTTLRLRRHQRGIEPDRCYWIAHEPQVRGKRKIDLLIDPPPDLAIEVDVTSSSLDKIGIYEDLKVPELWSLDSPVLTFRVLGADGRYGLSSHSLAFPMVTPADLMDFLNRRVTLGENEALRQFRAWIHQRKPA